MGQHAKQPPKIKWGRLETSRLIGPPPVCPTSCCLRIAPAAGPTEIDPNPSMLTHSVAPLAFLRLISAKRLRDSNRQRHDILRPLLGCCRPTAERALTLTSGLLGPNSPLRRSSTNLLSGVMPMFAQFCPPSTRPTTTLPHASMPSTRITLIATCRTRPRSALARIGRAAELSMYNLILAGMPSHTSNCWRSAPKNRPIAAT